MSWSRCGTTGKTQHETKADARRARNGTHRSRDDGALSIYRCDDCGYYHLGHQPNAVARGDWDKADWLEAKRERGQ